MTVLGNNVHIFARPHRRQELLWCFDTVLGCGPVASIEHPEMCEPMLLVRFPGGGHLSIEFVEDAPDHDMPRLGAWLELRAEDPQALMQAALNAGLPRVEHPGHPSTTSWLRAARCSPSPRSDQPHAITAASASGTTDVPAAELSDGGRQGSRGTPLDAGR
jgi:hypothetical protein